MVPTEQSLENRLSALEARIGVTTKNDGNNNTTGIASRLAAIETQWKSSTSSSNINKTWDESNHLFEDLSPGDTMSYQQSTSRSMNNPILYRKQIVLASQESLRKDMSYLSEILNLLYISQKQSANTTTETVVNNAPILHPVPNLSDKEERRLDSLRVKIIQTQQQTNSLVTKVDSLISTYQKAMLALSERVVAFEERLSEEGK